MGVMEARRRILLNQPHLIDAQGNPISFSTDMAAKMGVKAYFSPVQSGSGDPSPSNVRPISGWTGCEVTRCGKNLYPYSIIDAYSYGWYSGSTALADAVYPFFLKGGSSYVLSYTNANNDAKVLMRVWRKDGTILSNEPSVLNAKILNGSNSYDWVSSPQYYTKCPEC